MGSVLSIKRDWLAKRRSGRRLPWRPTHLLQRYRRAMTAKERLRELIDRLAELEAEVVLTMVERRRDDPILHALACARLDDEPSGTGEEAGAAEALVAYGRGEAVSAKQLRTELALT
jgi:hypothetical protein